MQVKISDLKRLIHENMRGMEMVSVELDVVTDEEAGPLSEFLAIAKQDYDLSTRVVSEEGPGGGWPVVEISGPSDNVQRFLVAEYGMDSREANEYIETGLY